VAAGGGNYFDGFGVGTGEEGARRRHLDGGKGRGAIWRFGSASTRHRRVTDGGTWRSGGGEGWWWR
jgi:hypothetical protein